MPNYRLDTDDTVFFYENEFYPLSNFSAFKVLWRGILFDTSEHAYHWEKFSSDRIIQKAILESQSAHEAFEIAQRCKAYRHPSWDTFKVKGMKEILQVKVRMHGYVQKKLLETGNRTLVEDSWRDDFWGWGPNRNGQNMMGKLWMQIRDEIRADQT